MTVKDLFAICKRDKLISCIAAKHKDAPDGANIAEAQKGQSQADFTAKMQIALKEANETENWLIVLHKSGIIDEPTFKSLRNKCGKIRRMLIASITTVKAKTNVDK